jgi:hypothetical protein
MTKHRDDRPLVWTGLRGKDNVVVLTDRAVYVARLSVQDVARVNRAFDDGQQPEDVLGKCRRVRLERVLAYEYQHSSIHSLAALTLVHGQSETRRRTVLAFPLIADRDKFKVELQARLGTQPWKPTETLEHPALVLLKYVGIVAALLLVTILLAIAEWKGGDHWFIGSLILLVGAVACVIIGGMGHREVRYPRMTIIHEPESGYVSEPEESTENAENE